MTDIQDKELGYNSGSSDTASFDQQHIFERPTGVKGFYYHPMTQVALLGFVCFMCPGLFFIFDLNSSTTFLTSQVFIMP
jgi:hypothetical protein